MFCPKAAQTLASFFACGNQSTKHNKFLLIVTYEVLDETRESFDRGRNE